MDKIQQQVDEWRTSNVHVFWGEIAPCDHSIQIYDNDEIFLTSLEAFASYGLLAGDSVVIIAIPAHLEELNSRLRRQNFDLDRLIEENRYFPLDAADTLSRFMVNNWPDEVLFERHISQLIELAAQSGKKVRAFGEMVALLWEKGHSGATVKLEHLWNQLHNKHHFTLYCAYPKTGFTQSASDSLHTICKTHSKIINGKIHSATEIYYRPVDKDQHFPIL